MHSEELIGEIEMIQAMYSDNCIIAGTSIENLHRHDTDEITTTSNISESHSPDHHNNNSSSSDITIITLCLPKKVEIELTCSSQGYLSSSSSSSKKLRVSVNHSPICIDSEVLLQTMKQSIKEHPEGEGGLIISVCQAAEQYVENVIANNSEHSKNNNNNNNNNNGVESSSSSSNSSSGHDFEADHQHHHHGNLGMGERKESSFSSMKDSRYGSNTSGGGSSSMLMMSSATTGGGELDEKQATEILASRGVVRLSTPIIDRKSKFVAHIAPIKSEREAMEIVALLREIKSIACACHPAIWAYRYTNPDTKVSHYDLDDDGEKSGAKNIMFVMEQMHVDGFIVVVTRYYGGIHLGNTRFRYIAQVTRDVILEAGVGSSTSGHEKTPSKKR